MHRVHVELSRLLGRCPRGGAARRLAPAELAPSAGGLRGGQQLLLARLDLDHDEPAPDEHRAGPGGHVADDPADQRAQPRAGERVRRQRQVAAEQEPGQPPPALGARTERAARG